jgi:hypothetical protein
MKRLRLAHLYLGVFFTPLLVFFIASGWYQTINPERLKSVSEAESIVQKLRVVHTDQIYPGDHEFRKPSSPKLFQGLVVVMSVALLATTVLGVVLAFRFSRTPWPVALCLGAGVGVPILILWAGRSP